MGGIFKRHHIVPAKYRLDGYDDTYDFHTLAYDVIWMERQKALLFVCPKLLNLADVFKTAIITASGQKLKKPRIKQYRRHDEVWLDCKTRPTEVTLEARNLSISVNVSEQAHEFDGKNVLITKSKNKALVWIADWVAHHTTQQSANAALVFDNGSTDYALSDVQQTLQSFDALDVAVAIASDFPFGSWKATKLLHRSMFYQAGMLSLARHRFLHSARAVLATDIDELVCGEDVFDAAVQSRLGYVKIPGFWRYSKLPEGQMPLHGDHVWRRDPDATCKEKYCLTPGRWFTETVWDIHGLHRYAFNGLLKLKNTRILHCEHVYNGWKHRRGTEQDAPLVLEKQSKADLEYLRTK
ncbi:hypothetical protein [Planktotalea sp.]|uniref:hypothetical protein n=1 Tax=Planktotalea sp. TaxID=2029877 RepID=UPI0025EF3BCC|nr:hypothetical protein [Planktotalea sp.]